LILGSTPASILLRTSPINFSCFGALKHGFEFGYDSRLIFVRAREIFVPDFVWDLLATISTKLRWRVAFAGAKKVPNDFATARELENLGVPIDRAGAVHKKWLLRMPSVLLSEKRSDHFNIGLNFVSDTTVIN
jgi:hypothetical protein